ncbi:MAG: DMT family transporter [Eubacterium sp.]|nr:DMT family transporter [Candidatus Colimonas fimequi]
MNKTIKANICIFIAAVIWGSAFVTQRMGMDSMGPFYFNALRNFLGSAVLILVWFVTHKMGIDKDMEPEYPASPTDGFLTARRKMLIKGGLVCGVVVCAAGVSQQIGLQYVEAGKSGFLTAMYIVIVPMLGVLLKQPVRANHFVGAILGVIGLYYLCINGAFTIAWGDLISLVGAFFWAVHILVIDHFAPKLNPIKLSAAQFFVSACLSLLIGSFVEEISMEAIRSGAIAIIYTGIMSSAVAFTLQVFAQRHANPTAASIIMSMEALFAVICGFLFLGEVLTARELFGCLVMLVAVIIAQVSPADLIKKKNS